MTVQPDDGITRSGRRAGGIGSPVSRVDGPVKVRGEARFTAEYHLPNLVHGVFVGSTVPRARIVGIDVTQAMKAPGVQQVFTHENLPKVRSSGPSPGSDAVYGQSHLPMQDDHVRYEGQHLAIVVAETLEQAQYAAGLVVVDYEREYPAVTRLDDALHHLEEVTGFAETHTLIGDVASGLNQADEVVDATYRTADRHHNPMEPSATTAVWDGERTDDL